MLKHPTKLEINLKSLVHNLNYYKSLVPSETKMMAMVKAFSYGNGGYELAEILQQNNIDYFGVAFNKEGVKLRKSGITTKIAVMNPDSDISDIIEYNLEPTFFSISKLKYFISQLKDYSGKKIPVHLKFNTGMNRLGFSEHEKQDLLGILKSTEKVFVQSVFSHLSASDEAIHDDFTHEQIAKLTKICNTIEGDLPYKFMKHITNSLGVERFPEASFDMVRIGIGLYGFSSENQGKLKNVSTLKTEISQIRNVAKGETVGYNRKWKVNKESKIAIIPIGYGDGISRQLSNGVGEVLINKQKALIVGNVCMDICMLDITNINAKEGDEVIIFGDDYPADKLAEKLNTISYEIITAVSERVERVYLG